MLQLVGYGYVGRLDAAFVGWLLFAFPGLGFVFVFVGCLFVVWVGFAFVAFICWCLDCLLFGVWGLGVFGLVGCLLCGLTCVGGCDVGCCRWLRVVVLVVTYFNSVG